MSREWKKTPGDTEAYTVTWYGTDPNIAYALDATESITASTWTLSGDLVEASSSFNATSTTIFISGGTEGERYTIQNRVEVDSGRILVRSVYVYVVELWVN